MEAGRPTTLWYFAYGSNMSSAKFTGSRGIVPLKSKLVRIPGWVLTMEIPGVPYAEPSFSAIRRREDSEAEQGQPDVAGVAYLITLAQYQKVVASEGGGIAYNDVLLDGVSVEDEERTQCLGGSRGLGGLQLRTLAAAMTRWPQPTPSGRYMTLLRDGAHEIGLPSAYQTYLADIPVLDPFPSARTRLGAKVFLAIWGPIFSALEKLTKFNLRRDGTSPLWVIFVVRNTILVMWAVHDYIFAPLFGRGDGLKATGGGDEQRDNDQLEKS
ncbi:hypothetical protein EJ04DRAFT_516215, partial [Polyplosphaeria fusca]